MSARAPLARHATWLLGWALGCAGAAGSVRPDDAASEYPPAAAAPAAEPQLTAAELQGAWVQYWTPQSGVADSQRYLFDDAGHFAWFAPPQSEQGERVLRKRGTFELQHRAAATELVLHVTAEELGTCASGCPGGSRSVEVSPARTERYELGECAQNREAHAVDAHYTCAAIGGHAFWRKPLSAAEAESQLRSQP